MIIKALTSLLSFALVAVLSGCSSGNSNNPSDPAGDGDPVNPSTNPDGSQVPDGTVMLGGGFCIVGDQPVIIGEIDENGNLVPVDPAEQPPAPDDAITCQTLSMPGIIDSPGISMNGTGSLSIEDQNIALSAAMFVFFDSEFEATPAQVRSTASLVLHDGETRFSRVEDSTGGVEVVYGMNSGSIALSSYFSAQGTDGVENRTYDIIPFDDEPDPLSDTDTGDVVVEPVLLIDRNGNGQFGDMDDEDLFLTAGQITWVGSKPNVEITINAQTADGVTVTGTYTGDYVDIPDD